MPRYVLIEVYVDKLGSVTGREFWRMPQTSGPAVRISARTYRREVAKGTPFRVNAHGPSGQFLEDDASE